MIAADRRGFGTKGNEALVGERNGRDEPGHDASFILLQSQLLVPGEHVQAQRLMKPAASQWS